MVSICTSSPVAASRDALQICLVFGIAAHSPTGYNMIIYIKGHRIVLTSSRSLIFFARSPDQSVIVSRTTIQQSTELELALQGLLIKNEMRLL